MGVEVIIVESAQMESCELFHDFEVESHADARFVDKGSCWGEKATVIGVFNVFHNNVGRFYETELAEFTAGKDIGYLYANALQEGSICDIEIACGEAEAFEQVFAGKVIVFINDVLAAEIFREA